MRCYFLRPSIALNNIQAFEIVAGSAIPWYILNGRLIRSTIWIAELLVELVGFVRSDCNAQHPFPLRQPALHPTTMGVKGVVESSCLESSVTVCSVWMVSKHDPAAVHPTAYRTTTVYFDLRSLERRYRRMTPFQAILPCLRLKLMLCSI